MIKKLLYSVYALFFNISRALFPIKENRVVFVSMHNENFNDSLGAVCREVEKKKAFETVYITRRDLDIKLSNVFRVIAFFLVKSRLLATAKYVFLNDNFMPMAKMNFRSEAVVTQLWHAEGVFKKFGLAIGQEESLRKNEIECNRKLTYVVCSSKAVVPYYAEAFGVSKENVLPLGAPRADFLLDEGNARKAKEKLCARYPELKNKKLVLYAPTFRDDRARNDEILSAFNAEKVSRELSADYALLIRLHPQIHPQERNIRNAVDLTDYDDVRELVLACDVLITDYSSICMDFALLSKKCVFFAYDLESYISDRDFYFDYEAYVPGRIVRTADEIAEAVKAPTETEKSENFRKFNFDYTDCGSAGRVVKRIMNC